MFLKNKNIIFKIRRSKVTDYAALRINMFTRFGITREDPNGTNDFIKETIAIHEDGFNKEKGTRIVSVDAFNFVTYENRQKKTKKDLAELTTDTKAWLYVLVIHGSLKVSLQIGKFQFC